MTELAALGRNPYLNASPCQPLLFSQVRGSAILRTSPIRSSKKFALQGFWSIWGGGEASLWDLLRGSAITGVMEDLRQMLDDQEVRAWRHTLSNTAW